jgi:hypothetical protein
VTVTLSLPVPTGTGTRALISLQLVTSPAQFSSLLDLNCSQAG